MSAGGDVSGHRYSKTAAITEVGQGLDQAFAEGLMAQQGGASVVLQRPCQDFAGTGRSPVHQGQHGAVIQG